MEVGEPYPPRYTARSTSPRRKEAAPRPKHHLTLVEFMTQHTDPRLASQFVRARRLPAWSTSLAVHVVLLILLGLALRPPLPKSLPTGDRVGGIVLAKVTAEETEYAEPEAAPAAEGAAAADNPALDEPVEAAAGIELPQPLAPLNAASGVRIGEADATGTGRPVIGSRGAGDGSQSSGRVAGPPEFSGPAARISVFGSGFAEGNSFVFVIDRSKSMGSDGLGVLSQAKSELADALASLDARHRFQIVAYHHERIYLDRAGLLPATPANKRRVAEFFDELAAFGGTDHELALFAALGMRPDVVFFLTDGGSPELNRAQVDQIVATAKRMGTTIHCVQFGFGPAPSGSFMLDLARRTGGSYRYVQRS